MSIKKGNSDYLPVADDEDSDSEEKTPQDGKAIDGNIMVYVRVRPLSSKEIATQEFDIIRVDKQLLVLSSIKARS